MYNTFSDKPASMNSRRRGRRKSVSLMVMVTMCSSLCHRAHAFVYPSVSSSSRATTTSIRPLAPCIIRPKLAPLTRQQAFFSPFSEEPWFSSDTIHVTEDEDIIIETTTDDEHQRAAPPQQPEEYKVGVIVVDHGSRRAEANEALKKVVEDFKSVSGYELVEPAHMELAEPSIATAFGKCVEQGATFIICHPFFLSRGRHVVEDIPNLLEEAASIFPGVNWALSQPLGLQAEIPRLMQSAVSQCMSEHNICSEDHAVYEPDYFL